MIELLTAPTPNGWKVSIMLEECALPYCVRRIDIGKGEQFAPDFLAVSPNNRIPAIIDHAPADGGDPVPVFETGAILLYLAEKTGQFLPADLRGRKQVMEWLFWQVGGLGPMLGQHGHFKLYAPERIAYATTRYRNEALRLYGVLDRQLARSAHVAGGGLFDCRHGLLSVGADLEGAGHSVGRFPRPWRVVRTAEAAARLAPGHGPWPRCREQAPARQCRNPARAVRHNRGHTMSARAEFFFDLSSPWTRIAFANFRKAVAGKDVAVTWRPFLVGGVFNAVNPSVYEGRKNPDDPKLRRSFAWLREWAQLAGVAMNFPSPHHPVKSVHAMRLCCALEEDQESLQRFSEAAFEAYFGEQRNLDDPDVLEQIATDCGLDGPALRAAAGSDACKARLRHNTQEAIDRGAFGSPTMFVEGTHMYFGNDQLPLVLQRLALSSSG